MGEPQEARLCKVCSKIDFAGILLDGAKPGTSNLSWRYGLKYTGNCVNFEGNDEKVKIAEDEQQVEPDQDDAASDDSWDSTGSHFLNTDLHVALGSIANIKSRQGHCNLCFKLWSHLRADTDVTKRRIVKSQCVLNLVELRGRLAKYPKIPQGFFNLVFIYMYKLAGSRANEWTTKTCVIIQAADRPMVKHADNGAKFESDQFDDDLYGQARLMKNECNYPLFRKWLDTCEESHAHSQFASSNALTFRLIDVRDHCLTEHLASQGPPPRFIALSYNWGVASQSTMLLSDRLYDFMCPGYFKGNMPSDQTIKDAITVTKALGERYLWIDSLCIIQNSDEDRSIQIPQMHIIYGGAVLTIVAAFGQNVKAGLPGVGIGSRAVDPTLLNVGGVSLHFRGSHPIDDSQGLKIVFAENYLRGSRYKNRAWTFQEGLVSKRLLIFTRDSVYWECDRCTWNEETHFESSKVDFVGWRALRNVIPDDVWLDKIAREAYDIGGTEQDDQSELARESYAAIVKEYTSRDLSREFDIHHACKGALAWLKEREQTAYVHALRGKHFGNDLLFSPLATHPRRFAQYKSVDIEIPTWSWLAWSGTIQIANEPRNNSYDPVENLIPCDGVKCYTLLVQGGRKTLKVINENGGWRFEKGYVRKGEGIYDLAEERLGIIPKDSDSSASEASDSNMRDRKEDQEIPVYPQDVDISEVRGHLAWRQLKTRFHIIFRTFYSTVLLKTEKDEWSSQMADLSTMMAGTTMTRSAGGPDTRGGGPSRNIYILHEPTNGQGIAMASGPRTVGSYAGHLPPPLKIWKAARDLYRAVPDGIYRMLWMNNNQLPMFGHILCRPVSPTASTDGRWDQEILERVASVIGPTRILEREQQVRYSAYWGTHILA